MGRRKDLRSIFNHRVVYTISKTFLSIDNRRTHNAQDIHIPLYQTFISIIHTSFTFQTLSYTLIFTYHTAYQFRRYPRRTANKKTRGENKVQERAETWQGEGQHRYNYSKKTTRDERSEEQYGDLPPFTLARRRRACVGLRPSEPTEEATSGARRRALLRARNAPLRGRRLERRWEAGTLRARSRRDRRGARSRRTRSRSRRRSSSRRCGRGSPGVRRRQPVRTRPHRRRSLRGPLRCYGRSGRLRSRIRA